MAKKATPTASKASSAKSVLKPAATAKPAPKAVASRKSAAPPPASLPKPAVVTLKQLATQFSASNGVPARQAQDILDSVVGLLVEHLKAGDKLRLNGLGILEVKDRSARTGRNPATGETVQIAASKKIAFRPAKELKAAI